MRPLILAALLLACITAAPAQTSPSFEAATIKSTPPQADINEGYWNHAGTGRFTAHHLSLTTLIQLAYDVDSSQIANKPDWLDSSLYDIDAKPEAGILLSREELKPRLQALLHQRFHLVVHTESRPVRGYALVAVKGGVHLTPTTKPGSAGDALDVSTGQMRGYNWSMPKLAKYLTHAAGFPVADMTGITGTYDISFSYNPKPDVESTLLPLDAALKQATGLTLRAQKVPIETIVIDSADKVPTAN